MVHYLWFIRSQSYNYSQQTLDSLTVVTISKRSQYCRARHNEITKGSLFSLVVQHDTGQRSSDRRALRRGNSCGAFYHGRMGLPIPLVSYSKRGCCCRCIVFFGTSRSRGVENDCFTSFAVCVGFSHRHSSNYAARKASRNRIKCDVQK